MVTLTRRSFLRLGTAAAGAGLLLPAAASSPCLDPWQEDLFLERAALQQLEGHEFRLAQARAFLEEMNREIARCIWHAEYSA